MLININWVDNNYKNLNVSIYELIYTLISSHKLTFNILLEFLTVILLIRTKNTLVMVYAKASVLMMFNDNASYLGFYKISPEYTDCFVTL